MTWGATVLLVGATFAGCAADPPVPGTSAAAATSPSLPETQQVRDAATIPGYSVAIPKLGVRSDLVGLGLNPDRTVQVPPLDQPGQLGVYDRGPRPGAAGPAVLLGHVNGRDADGRSVPGVFAALDTVTEGDHVDVTVPDGRTVRFEVYRVTAVDKERFPTAQVYGDTAGPELRLVTCGGEFDAASRNYLSNVIVYARLEQP